MNKKYRILFITDSCPPYLTMSGVVVKNIIDYLEDKSSIDIIAIQQGDEDVLSYRGITIDYIKSFPYHILKNRRKMESASNELVSAFYSIVVLCYRLCSVAMRVVSPIGLNIDMVKRIKKAVERRISSSEYDYIFCNAKPFEAFEAVSHITKDYPKTCYIAYQTDDFVTAGDERYIPKFLVNKKLKRRAERINYYSDCFNVYGMLESVYKKEIAYFKSSPKIKRMGIPLLMDRHISEKERHTNKNIKFVYAGSLVKAFRPPNDCLDIMLEVARNADVTVDVYHRGDCGEIVDTYAERSRGVIINKGSVSTEEAYNAMCEADVLISISNTAGDQISGKTFDYISTCKPIVHFCYSENDMNSTVIKRYPNGLCVCIGKEKSEDTALRIIEFVMRIKDNDLDFNELAHKFKEYTVDSVVNELFEDIDFFAR